MAVPPTATYLRQFEIYGEKSKLDEFIPLSPRTETSINLKQNLSPREILRSPKANQNNKLFVFNSKLQLSEEIFVQK